MTSMTTAAVGAAGLRPSTAAGRAALCRADSFAGLPEGMGRWRVMAAVRTAAAALDLSPMMLRLLEHYVDLTWDIDWTVGCEPVVYRPLVEIAAALGRTERQIRNIERSLAERGLLAWRDSGNHHRHGRRDQRSGRLVYAYGVSLGPMGARAAEFIALAETVRRDAEATRRLRIAVSALRRRLRTAILAATEIGVEPGLVSGVADILETVPARSHAGDDRVTLEGRHETLTRAESRLAAAMANAPTAPATGDSTGMGEIGNREYDDTKTDIAINGYRRRWEPQGSTDRPSGPISIPRPAGPTWQGITTRLSATTRRDCPRHPASKPRPISLELALACATRPTQEAWRRSGANGWAGLADTMRERCALLDIDQNDWAEGCATLGRTAAALCMIVVEHGISLKGQRAVRRPAAYFRAMIERGREQRLHLDRSLYAIARARC